MNRAFFAPCTPTSLRGDTPLVSGLPRTLLASTLFSLSTARGLFPGDKPVLLPNYVSKPTAGDGLQLFRLLPAGSGLTRR
jgi:hypothetical protein